MKKRNIAFAAAHVLLAALLAIVVFAAKQRPTVRAGGSMLVGLELIELLFLARYFSARKKRRENSSSDIMIFVWLLQYCAPGACAMPGECF